MVRLIHNGQVPSLKHFQLDFGRHSECVIANEEWTTNNKKKAKKIKKNQKKSNNFIFTPIGLQSQLYNNQNKEKVSFGFHFIFKLHIKAENLILKDDAKFNAIYHVWNHSGCFIWCHVIKKLWFCSYCSNLIAIIFVGFSIWK